MQKLTPTFRMAQQPDLPEAKTEKKAVASKQALTDNEQNLTFGEILDKTWDDLDYLCALNKANQEEEAERIVATNPRRPLVRKKLDCGEQQLTLLEELVVRSRIVVAQRILGVQGASFNDPEKACEDAFVEIQALLKVMVALRTTKLDDIVGGGLEGLKLERKDK
jgi:hypothetical protein